MLDQGCLGQDLFKVKMEGKSFSLDPFEKEQMLYSTKENVTKLWHKRLGHYHYQGLVKMQKLKMVESLPDLATNSAECHACRFGKQHRKPFPKSTWRASQKLQLVHTDVAEPQRTPSLQGNSRNWWKIKIIVRFKH